jgi:mutual gliding-motility protein MglA
MALINHRAREIHFKIVYVGPGLGGKTTNLQMLHDRLPPERRGRLVSISTDHERTLFFDFLPVDLGQVNGFLTRFHLYTVPGQVYYRLSRRAVLQGLDGLIFVADSHPAREQANRESLDDALTHLAAIGMDASQIARVPWVFQYNKRDLKQALPIERLRALLHRAGSPEFEAVASEGRGVSETLRAACKAVLARLTNDVMTARPAAPSLATGRPGAATSLAPSAPAATVQRSSLLARPSLVPVATAAEALASRPHMPPPRIATAPRRNPRDIRRA